MDFSKLDDIMLIVNDVKEELIKEYKELEKKLLCQIDNLNLDISNKKNKINELQKKIDENDFNENNYNRVSILRMLSKENDELKQQNSKLMASLNYRSNRTSTPSSQFGSERGDYKDNEQLDENIQTNSESVDYTVETNNDCVEEKSQVESESIDDKAETNNDCVEETNDDIVEEEETKNKIQYKGKLYYIEDNKAYRVKKNGDKGKKIGIYSNGKIKFTEKKKK